MFGLLTDVWAQSGRRVKSAPPQTTTTQVQITQDSKETEEWVGYSESSPNASRPIYARSRNEKKSKKDSKKDTKKKTESPAPTTIAVQTDASASDEEIVKLKRI
jgi:hypothetical protein